MTMMDGLKVRVKRRLVRAIRAGLSDEFWHTIDDGVGQLDPQKQVLGEFPVQKMAFPFLRVGVTFDRSTWVNLNRYILDWDGSPGQVGKCTATSTIEVYARDARQRDRIEDALMFMLLFQYTRPNDMAFVDVLGSQEDGDVNLGFQPVLNSIRMGSDSATNRIPWNADSQVYVGSLSFDSVITYTMRPEAAWAIIRRIGVEATAE